MAEVEGFQCFGECEVRGQRLRMHLDTGAGAPFVLFRHAADRLGIDTSTESGGRALVEWPTGDVETPVFDGMGIAEGMDGVVGWPVLKATRWMIDVDAGVQRFASSVPADVVRDWQSFPIVELHGAMHFTVSDGESAETVLFDTGSPEGFGLSRARWSTWSRDHEDVWRTAVAGFYPAAGFVYSHLCVAPDFGIGSLELGPTLVAPTFVAPERCDTGLRGFAQRAVWVDGPGGKLYVGPRRTDALDLTDVNPVQATFVPMELETPPMAFVVDGGFAWRQGLRSGDRIVTVNGRDAASWRHDPEVRPSNVFSAPRGSKVSLLIEREGERKLVEFVMPAPPIWRDGGVVATDVSQFVDERAALFPTLSVPSPADDE